ncbi:MAG: NAD(P)/FAD-dependent oxidoreductase [Proteobacteria bacterium]|nr:NAD(P)/FAD-dependent oxidoreductase [Pseudomonadota bacterium]
MEKADVVIIGAGASGLMCAIEAGKRGRKVVVLDHASKPGSKILISGGGRSNFTNYDVGADNYISGNAHFCKSALSQFSQWDFISMMESYGIPFCERSHGQLFCDKSARDILNMLLEECERYSVSIRMSCKIELIEREAGHHFLAHSSRGDFHCQSLVIATGGLSLPDSGATPFGYKLAKQFGINICPTSPGLVPLTLQPQDKARFSPLSGIAVDAMVRCLDKSFRENLLFTHRGLSGPAILQISSYWKPGADIIIDLLPDSDLEEKLLAEKQKGSGLKLKTILTKKLPKRLIASVIEETKLEQSLQEMSRDSIKNVVDGIRHLIIRPNGTEGYRTAEVTLGGIDCDEVSSKTMECRNVPGLYFTGELLDVTGWLGGYNLQWAWSSGWTAGQYV